MARRNVTTDGLTSPCTYCCMPLLKSDSAVTAASGSMAASMTIAGCGVDGGGAPGGAGSMAGSMTVAGCGVDGGGATGGVVVDAAITGRFGGGSPPDATAAM